MSTMGQQRPLGTDLFDCLLTIDRFADAEVGGREGLPQLRANGAAVIGDDNVLHKGVPDVRGPAANSNHAIPRGACCRAGADPDRPEGVRWMKGTQSYATIGCVLATNRRSRNVLAFGRPGRELVAVVTIAHATAAGASAIHPPPRGRRSEESWCSPAGGVAPALTSSQVRTRTCSHPRRCRRPDACPQR
jgi:hypothetical protein